MKRWTYLVVLVMAGLLRIAPGWAEVTPDELKKLVDEAVEKRLRELDRREGVGERKDRVSGPTSEP